MQFLFASIVELPIPEQEQTDVYFLPALFVEIGPITNTFCSGKERREIQLRQGSASCHFAGSDKQGLLTLTAIKGLAAKERIVLASSRLL
jgi:hypothetical protein